MGKDFKFGYEGVIYYSATLLDQRPGDTDGSNNFTNVPWQEMDNVTDVDGDYSAETVDTTTRAEAKKGWKSEVKSIKAGVTKWSARWKPSGTDSAFDVLRNAWLSGNPIPIMDLDGKRDEPGSQGLVGNMSVEFSKKKPVKGIMMVDITVSVQSFPDWVKVNDGGNLEAVEPEPDSTDA